MSCGALSQMYELLQRGDYLISYRALLTDIRSSFGTHAALLRKYRALLRLQEAESLSHKASSLISVLYQRTFEMTFKNGFLLSGDAKEPD